MEGKNNDFINLSIFGNLNSGKCSLIKALSIDTGCIATPNHLTYKGRNYYIPPIPCAEVSFAENYDLSTFLCDIAIIVLDASESDTVANKPNLDTLRYLFIKGVSQVIICLNKLDKTTISTDQFELLRGSFENCVQDEGLKFLYPQNKIYLHFIGISATESINIKEYANSYGLPYESSLLDLLHSLKLPGSFKHPLFKIYDCYYDTEDKLSVLSGKIISGTLGSDEEYKLFPLGDSIKVTKLCNCHGEYLDTLTSYNFATVYVILI
jgi:translation elongation factor EF-1alpha